MSDAHKKTLEQANAAISRGDFEGFLAHCTEDTVWRFLGDRTLRGKAEVRAWMAEAYRQPPRFKLQRMIAEGDSLAALGQITLIDDAGKEAEFAYCDVWRFEDGKLAELQAYVIAQGD